MSETCWPAATERPLLILGQTLNSRGQTLSRPEQDALLSGHPGYRACRPDSSSSDTLSFFFTLLLPRLLGLFLHAPGKACRARIGLGGLRGRGNVIHLRHGQLAHGVFRVLWMAAGEVDVLNVAHFEEKVVKVGGERWSGLGCGDFPVTRIMTR